MNEILTQEKSIYIQIREMIENDILRDILLEEERVPSTNELAKLYAINPATGAKRQIMEKRKKNFYEDYIKSLLAEAKSLGISRQELISMIGQNEER